VLFLDAFLKQVLDCQGNLIDLKLLKPLKYSAFESEQLNSIKVKLVKVGL
jgi:hypothetical protein